MISYEFLYCHSGVTFGCDLDRKNELKQELIDKIMVLLHGDNIEGRTLHARSPSAKKYVKERVHASIEIYGRYLV